MPDAPFAELITGDSDWGGQHERVTETDRGTRGVRHYKVNTADQARALLAQGLPRRGHSWSAEFPNLRVVLRDPEYIAGQDDSATGVGGYTGVRVEYETAGFSGRIVPREVDGPGDYTEFAWEPRSTRVYYDARAGEDPDAFPLQIDNGRGVDKNYAVLVAVVHRFRDGSTPTPNARIAAAFAEPINAAPITLPPEQGASGSITLQALEARFAGFERRVVPVVGGDDSAGTPGVELIFRLELAPTFSEAGEISGHDVFWQQEDAGGNPVAFRTNWVDLRSDYHTLIDA